MSGENNSSTKSATSSSSNSNNSSSGALNKKKSNNKCRGGCAHPPPPSAAAQSTSSPKQNASSPKQNTSSPKQNATSSPAPAAAAPTTTVGGNDKEEALSQENLNLKAQQKELEAKLDDLQSQYDKSMLINTRLESLCGELRNRTKVLKEESEQKIQEAEDRGKVLTKEVSGNLGVMENINENLQQITKENLESRKYNENLATQINAMRTEYEKKETLIQEQIKETNDKVVKAHTELAQIKLANSQDKERTFGELKKLATEIVESREGMQIIKETELTLRKHIQNYDEKFIGLQLALKETNAAYEGFKGEMEKISDQAKNLEVDATKWQNRWEESNVALVLVEQTHARLQAEIQRTSVSLETMTNLYKALQKEHNKNESAQKGASSSSQGQQQAASNNALPVSTNQQPKQMPKVEPEATKSIAQAQVAQESKPQINQPKDPKPETQNKSDNPPKTPNSPNSSEKSNLPEPSIANGSTSPSQGIQAQAQQNNKKSNKKKRKGKN